MTIVKKNVFITGVSGGIGQALAIAFMKTTESQLTINC